MNKIIATAVVIVAFGSYALFYYKETVLVTPHKNNQSADLRGSGTSAQTGYKDGTYTGSAADAFYGTLQVQAIIHGGKVTDVRFLRYPNDQPESISVSQVAMPALKQEAIAAQNASVDIVSGATQTSEAFRQSLAFALSQAK